MTVNLSTTHLGLPLKNPLVASASPLSRTVDGVRRLEDAGVAAIVLHPLFAEQISMARSPHGAGSRTVAGGPKLALNYFPRWDHDPAGPDGYLEEVGLAKRSVGVPVIAGLNGTPPGEWTQYARLTEEAGADALELNLCDIPTDPLLTGEAVERMHLGVVREVRRTVRSPVAVKIGPHFSSLPDMARRRGGAGANVCMLASELLQNGASRAGTTLPGDVPVDGAARPRRRRADARPGPAVLGGRPGRLRAGRLHQGHPLARSGPDDSAGPYRLPERSMSGK